MTIDLKSFRKGDRVLIGDDMQTFVGSVTSVYSSPHFSTCVVFYCGADWRERARFHQSAHCGYITNKRGWRITKEGASP